MNPHGKCIIFCNSFNGKSDPNHDGSNKDIPRLKNIFEWLGYKVVVHNDRDIYRMKHDLKREAGKSQNFQHDSLILIFLSFGNLTSVLGNGAHIQHKHIYNCFRNINERHHDPFDGKPIIFFFITHKALDSQPVDIGPDLPQSSYIVIKPAFTISDKSSAKREDEFGTVYINALCDALEKCHPGESTSLNSLTTDVSNEVKKYYEELYPSYQSNPSKDFFISPKTAFEA